MPETAIYVPLFTPESMACSGENKVDIVGVTGSIPVTPTILIQTRACRKIGEPLLRFGTPCCVPSVPHEDSCRKSLRPLRPSTWGIGPLLPDSVSRANATLPVPRAQSLVRRVLLATQFSGGGTKNVLACGGPINSYRRPTLRRFARQSHETS